MNIGKETETIEFKKSTSETKEGIISITSILNKHGNGILYFGVNDNGDVIGQVIGRDTERKLSRDIATNIRPSVWYEIRSCKSEDNKSFLEVIFNGSNAPYSAYGRYYQRFADEDKQINDSELEKLFQLRKRNYSEWEEAASIESISNVNEELLKSVIRRGNESGRIKYDYTSCVAMLSKLGLLYLDNETLTNAGRVLF